jgi:hypothetical protein
MRRPRVEEQTTPRSGTRGRLQRFVDVQLVAAMEGERVSAIGRVRLGVYAALLLTVAAGLGCSPLRNGDPEMDDEAEWRTWYQPSHGWSVGRSVAAARGRDVAVLVTTPFDAAALIAGSEAMVLTPADMRPVAIGWTPTGAELLVADSPLDATSDSLVVLSLDGKVERKFSLDGAGRVAMESQIVVASDGESAFLLASNRSVWDGRYRVASVDLVTGQVRVVDEWWKVVGARH